MPKVTGHLFISLPMSGRDPNMVEARINDIYNLVRRYLPTFDWVLLNTNWNDSFPEPDNRLYGLGRSIQELGKADIVIFASDWKQAKGCRVEYVISQIYGIPRMFEADLRNFLDSVEIAKYDRWVAPRTTSEQSDPLIF